MALIKMPGTSSVHMNGYLSDPSIQALIYGTISGDVVSLYGEMYLERFANKYFSAHDLTLAHLAAERNNVKALAVIIHDVPELATKPNRYGATPLVWAMLHNSLGAVNWLMLHTDSINMCTSVPFHLSMRCAIRERYIPSEASPLWIASFILKNPRLAGRIVDMGGLLSPINTFRP